MDKINIPSFKINATMYGVNEALSKANELVDTLKKANSLIEELANLNIAVDFDHLNDFQQVDD